VRKWLVTLGIGAVVVIAAVAYFLVIAPRSNQTVAQATTQAPAAAPAQPATPPPATTEPTKDQTAAGQTPTAGTTPPAGGQQPDSSTAAAPATTTPSSPPPQTAVAPPPAVAPATPAPNQPEIGPNEHVLGKADAPVTIIEYASLTCPHCAEFHNVTMPKVKSEFVEKGQARLVFRPFPLDRLALSASLLAQCAPGDGYFSMLAILFRSQQTWEHAQDPVAALKQIGRTAGMTEDAIDKCLADKTVIDQIVAGMKEAQEKFKVDATPTFIINGKSYPGALPFDDYDDGGTSKPGFGKIVRDLLPKS